ncbi:response regulator [Novosphingobium sp. CECT 9465]|uniref:response regulator n=1 Tax=Novosphingobium sp. CECT 9465 TaxID=2829794 RepID=UPI001E509750|nr:response regulator [Novosphingobium sp. CECT 9465]CAH0497564.1 hypothetical protein NVSP9465_02628 [Novosphingobium sp. CECT 9465]
MRVLLLEDEPLLAMLLEETIADLGHQPIGAAATVAQALALLESEVVDCALLDYSLGDTATSVPVAQRLQRDGIPFCYLSGHNSLEPEENAPEGPLLTKPASIDTLARALDSMAVLRIRADYPSAPGSPA